MTKMTQYQPDILERFRARLAQDKDHFDVPDWMLGWLYKDQTNWIDFDDYRGSEQLAALFRWSSWKPPVCFLDSDDFRALIAASIEFDKSVIARCDFSVDDNALRDTAILNAMDYTFCHCYPMPAEYQARRILDFGPGHGRQFNLWSQFAQLKNYIAMDATPLMYCAQHQYFCATGHAVFDYIMDGDQGFSFDAAEILQLPTWRHDLLPSDSIDLVMAVEVLPELHPKMVPWAIAMFHRVLKPGGALYIRDQDMLISRNRVPVSALLSASGFVLEFRPHLVNEVHMLGIPRVWRKLNPDAVMTL
jgi:SAM-dependent methyltransferase